MNRIFGIHLNLEFAEYQSTEKAFSRGAAFCFVTDFATANYKDLPSLSNEDFNERADFEIKVRDKNKLFEINGWKVINLEVKKLFERKGRFILTVEDSREEIVRIESGYLSLHYDADYLMKDFIDVFKEFFDLSRYESIKMKKLTEEIKKLKSENERLGKEIDQ